MSKMWTAEVMVGNTLYYRVLQSALYILLFLLSDSGQMEVKQVIIQWSSRVINCRAVANRGYGGLWVITEFPLKKMGEDGGKRREYGQLTIYR